MQTIIYSDSFLTLLIYNRNLKTEAPCILNFYLLYTIQLVKVLDLQISDNSVSYKVNLQERGKIQSEPETESTTQPSERN